MRHHESVYLDHNATTPVDIAVRQSMERWETAEFGNPASGDHRYGWNAAQAIEEARISVLDTIRAWPATAVFTSSATEALNTVLRFYIGWRDWDKKKIVTCATEHDAVLTTSQHLCRATGVRLQILQADRAGNLDIESLRRAIDGVDIPLVCIMAANSEIGTLHPIREIGEVIHGAGGWLLCDTTQAVGKSELDFAASGIDFATVSAHKIYGPKGAGALIVRNDLSEDLNPLILGGGQESGLRAGTPNVPGIVGLGAACRLIDEHLDQDIERMRRLRDRLESGIQSQVPHTWANGDSANRLCNTANIGFKGIAARLLIRDMDDIAVSTRSACSSAGTGPSHVLKAIGLSDADAQSCVRFSVGRATTEGEIDYAIAKVVASAHKLRRGKAIPSNAGLDSH